VGLVKTPNPKPSVKGAKKIGWLVGHQGAEGFSTADAITNDSDSQHQRPYASANDTESLIVHHLSQHYKPQIVDTNRSAPKSNQSVFSNSRYRRKRVIDYREYPTEICDTLRHYSELWSLPTSYEEAFPVRGGPTCIPRCAPYDDGLFLIAEVSTGDVLCPVNGTSIPIHRVQEGSYKSPYLVQDDRSQTIIDMADYRCGYARLANDIFDSRLYTCMIRTDTSPWVLVATKDMNH
jgi:hypothetical protein